MNPGPLFNWPFQGLLPRSYDLLAVDPPWDFSLYSEKGGNKSAQKHYRCLPLDEIKSFPIGDLASDNSLILLWGTSPMLPDQIECLRYWGFSYKTCAVWRKTTRNGKVAFGAGYILRGACEFVLIGSRGKPQNISKSTRSIFDGMVREHSRKPESFFTWAEKMMPRAERRAEIFSRANRFGWDSWGDQVGKFTEGAEDGGIQDT